MCKERSLSPIFMQVLQSELYGVLLGLEGICMTNAEHYFKDVTMFIALLGKIHRQEGHDGPGSLT